MELYKELARLMMATEGSPLVLGGVEFWIDADGPWAGQLTYTVETSKWNAQAMGKDVSDLARCYPEVARIVAWHTPVYAGPVDVSTVTEYGLTQKLSNSIRVY